jgi:excisionase family DNA binding protein
MGGAVVELPRALTVEQVRQALNIGRKQAYDLCASGRLKSFRVGVSVRVSEEALREYMNQGQEPATGQEPRDAASF